jgi:hypothetical protein
MNSIIEAQKTLLDQQKVEMLRCENPIYFLETYGMIFIEPDKKIKITLNDHQKKILEMRCPNCEGDGNFWLKCKTCNGKGYR